MSKRIAEFITDSALAKSKLVRNLRAYHLHSSSSPSWTNHRSNQAGITSEQDANRVHSDIQRSQSSATKLCRALRGLFVSKDVRKAQSSEDDKTTLSGMQKSVALKHEEPDDLT